MPIAQRVALGGRQVREHRSRLQDEPFPITLGRVEMSPLVERNGAALVGAVCFIEASVFVLDAGDGPSHRRAVAAEHERNIDLRKV